MRRIILLLVGLIISAVSLYFALRGFDFGDVLGALSRVQLLPFALMIVPFILTFMTKVWRWHVMFYPDERRVSNNLLFGALMISYIPLPFRLGEVARGAVTSRRSGLPAPRVFSTIVVEKVLDVLTLLLFLGISIPFITISQSLQGAAVTLAVGATLVALVLLALVLRPSLAMGLARFVAAKLPSRFGQRIETGTAQVLQGFAPMSNPVVALKIVLWSLVTWGINVVTVYLMMRAFNIEVSPMAAMLVVVVTNLSMAVPAAPGSIGTFEAAVVAVLGVLHIEQNTSQSFALLYHFIGLAPVAVLGIIAMIQQGVKLGSLSAGRTTEAVDIPPQAQPLPTARGKH